MQHHWKPWLWLAAIGLPAFAASAGFPVPQTMKCPIGGKSFTHITTGSYSIWGYRPDGKPYGSWDFPLKLPKCPGNGLVLFDEFGREELKRLEALVGSQEYRAIRDKETRYYLAAWLMERLGRPPVEVAWMVVQASWEADGSPEVKRRYQAEYIDRIRKLEKTGDGTDWLLMHNRAVNGLRELERFDEARALLASLDLKPLDVPIPEEKKGAATPSGLGYQVLNHEEIREAKRKRAFLDQFKTLGELIEARNSDSEPLRLIPPREAAGRCQMMGDEAKGDDKAYCESEEIRKLSQGSD